MIEKNFRRVCAKCACENREKPFFENGCLKHPSGIKILKFLFQEQLPLQGRCSPCERNFEEIPCASHFLLKKCMTHAWENFLPERVYPSRQTNSRETQKLGGDNFYVGKNKFVRNATNFFFVWEIIFKNYFS